MAVYLIIPFVIYLSEKEMVSWMSRDLIRLYSLSFPFLVVFVIVTVKLFSRRQGFQITPMDFLILFVALVVPNLPVEQIRSYQIGPLAAKIIVLLFSYEVLFKELRGELKGVFLTTLAILLVISTRGFVGPTQLILGSSSQIGTIGFTGIFGILMALQISRKKRE